MTMNILVTRNTYIRIQNVVLILHSALLVYFEFDLKFPAAYKDLKGELFLQHTKRV